ncbi:hypothetical protein FKG94_03755 [Exilibacterium tricleocarpae]|uniref:Uncharacterized protein n=1 Tax=Exilibacterium tricleocarpae TaxID=2591008 RepID=A0A545U5A9_9GAMM|nr:hypothetical protein [Exilibacterium tricleocarpae]TQV84647.1 hypothetical protein FKG94_03755 [Exilibacterium tricleocarpae]
MGTSLNTRYPAYTSRFIQSFPAAEGGSSKVDNTITIAGEVTPLISTSVNRSGGEVYWGFNTKLADIVKVQKGIEEAFQVAIDHSKSDRERKEAILRVGVLTVGSHMYQGGNMAIARNAMEALAAVNGYKLKPMSATGPLDVNIFLQPDNDQLVRDVDRYFYR